MYKISSDIVLCAEFATKYMRRYFCAYYWSKLGLGQGEALRLGEETVLGTFLKSPMFGKRVPQNSLWQCQDRESAF